MTVGRAAGAFCAVAMIVAGQAISAFGASTSTDEAVPLRAGRIGDYLWSSFIEHPELAEERESGRICLAVSMLEPVPGNRAEGNEAATCQAPPSDRPLIESISGGAQGKVRTVIAVIFPAGVSSVKLKVRGEPMRTVRAQIARLPATFNVDERNVPYIGRGYTHKVCIESMKGYDKSGAAIAALGRRPCF